MRSSAPASRRSFTLIAVLAVLLGMLAPLVPLNVPPVLAQPVCIVTTSADAGSGSLRAHIGNPTCSTITFADSVSLVDLTSGTLQVNRPLHITGRDLGGVTVQRATSNVSGFRIFTIGASATSVTLDGLTITRGFLPSNHTEHSGGGVYIASGANVSIVNSKVISNTVFLQGAGIRNDGVVAIRNTVVRANLANSGGGIFATPGSTTLIENSTIADNEARVWGGGILNMNGYLTIANSTLSANRGNQSGGAINSYGSESSNGSLTISNSTIANNISPGATGILQERYGPSTNHPVILRATIVDDTCARNNPSLTFTGDYNLLSDSSCAVTGGTGNQTGVDPLLGALTGDVDETPVHVPLQGSPAIGYVADDALCTTPDQRGQTRIAPGCTAGAVEYVGDLVVRNTNDSGPNSLRWAIEHTPAGGTVTFDIPGAVEQHGIQLTSGQLVIDKDLTIQGPNQTNNAAIEIRGQQGDTPFRVFQIGYIASAEVDIRNVSITNGQSLEGGGVYVGPLGDVTISGSVISGNSAGYGAGINNLGTLHIVQSTIDRNEAEFVGAAIGNDGTATVDTSTISNNTAGNHGGGIDSRGALTVTNSTFSGNTVLNASDAGRGGAIHFYPEYTNESMTISSSTIYDNTARRGDGIYSWGGQIELSGTIVAGVTAGNACVFAAGGAITSSEYSLGNDSSCFGATGTNLVDTNLTLPLLADNGGPTETHMPQQGSLAIDNGSCDDDITTDQRGFDREFGDDCDIGAVEVRYPTLTLPDDQTLIAAVAAGREYTFTASANGVAVTCALDPELDPPAGTISTFPADITFPVGTTDVNCQTNRVPADGFDIDVEGSFSVTVNAPDGPTMTQPQDVQAIATVANGANVTYPLPTATDAYNAPLLVSCTPASGLHFNLNDTTVTCTATDDWDQEVQRTFTVTVNLPDGPTMDQPDNIQAVATSADGAVVTYDLPEAEDYWGTALTVTCLPASGAEFEMGPTTVTCSASDLWNQPVERTFTVSVTDPDGPTMTQPEDIQAIATVANGANVTYPLPTAVDAYNTPLTVGCDPESGTHFDLGPTTVTCMATDEWGQDVVRTFTVTVNVPGSPTMTQPADIEQDATGPGGAVVTYSLPTAVDAYNQPLAVTCLPASGTEFIRGATTVTCTATDAWGQTVQRTFTVSVGIPSAPTMTQPANISVTSSSPDGLTIEFASPAARDFNNEPLSVSCLPPSGMLFPLGTTTVTCTSDADAFNRTVARSFTVTVTPAASLSPQITVPATTRFFTTNPAGIPVSFDPEVTSLIDDNPAVTCTPPSGSLFPVGTSTVSCTVIDRFGLTTTGSFQIIVVLGDGAQPPPPPPPGPPPVEKDTTPPALSLPDDITAVAGEPVTFEATATDDRDDAPVVTCEPPSGSTFPVGTTTVTCTATDSSGNVTTDTFTVTVVEDEPEEPGAIDTSAFDDLWARTDKPVADGDVSRTWIYGPGPFSGLQQAEHDLWEAYGDGERVVRYYDKARMEITNPDADPESTWFVTTGLLVMELITGQMQVGDDEFVERAPAAVVLAGDLDDPDSPTYASLAGLLGGVDSRVGELITERLAKDGGVLTDASLAGRNVAYAHYDDVTGHNIAEPFWTFMNATGLVYEDDMLSEDLLFLNPYFAVGRPITEAYWATVLVGGTPHEVLLQCFERRCLTYTPENDPTWQIEAGNVGLHYFVWRYTN